jgi:hypothetical protein
VRSGDDYVEKAFRQLNRLAADAEAAIATLKAQAALAQELGPLADRVRAYCRKVAGKLERMDFADRREVLSALQVRVTVGLDRVVNVFCVVPAQLAEDPSSDGRYVTLRHA